MSYDVKLKLMNCNNKSPFALGKTSFLVDTFPSQMIDVLKSFKSYDSFECPIKYFRIDRIVNNKTNSTERNPDQIAKINNYG